MKLPATLALFESATTAGGPLKPGCLMATETDKDTQYRHIIWFDYTLALANFFGEGDILAVENFSTTTKRVVWSLLEITEVMPRLFALGNSAADIGTSYPGFVVRAARTANLDLRSQETHSTEDTTKLVVTAIPLNLQLVISKDGTGIKEVEVLQDTALPILGGEVHVASPSLLEALFNHDLAAESKEVVEIGANIPALRRNRRIPIRLNTEALMRTHFGIFGFTGVGKSNLMNGLVGHLLATSAAPIRSGQHETSAHKVVLFDLMEEYKALLLDQLTNPEIDATLLCVGERTLTEPVRAYVVSSPTEPAKQQQALLEAATDAFHGSFLLPRSLDKSHEKFRSAIREFLEKRRIRFADTRYPFVSVFWDDKKPTMAHENFPPLAPAFTDAIEKKAFEPHIHKQLRPEVATQIKEAIEACKNDPKYNFGSLKGSYVDRVEQLLTALDMAIDVAAPTVPTHTISPTATLVERLNDHKKPALIVVISHDPDELRRYSKHLGNSLFESRRRTGSNGPSVSFVFDEADEFLPAQPTKDSQKASKAIVEQLARRGRKFGIGVGLATQRITYMDTSSIGQLNTYFISKLPRDADRQKVGEAFSLSDEVFRQTFKFRKGDWLLLSHSSTGLLATPIPVHVENSEERLERLWTPTQPKK